MSHPQFITSADALQPHLQRWAARPWLALDTEFVRVDTYYPKLCLIQIGDGEVNACIDTLALSDLAPLLELLARGDILKIFHAASQDLEILVQLTGACPAPLFDTQTAAMLLGIGDQIGYAGLVEKRLGIVLDKSLTRTDWSRRPLTAPELDYAAADVQHLATLYPMLREELEKAGRLGWLEEDCARDADPAHYRTEPANAWRKLKGLARMPAAAQTLAAALADWREREAQARNRPRKWIIEDDAIYRIAERAPTDLAQIEALHVLQPKTLARHGETLLKIVEEARTQPARIFAGDERMEPEQKALMKRLQEKLRELAASLKLPVSTLAPRADVEALMLEGAQARIPLLNGWRREVAGAEVLKLL
ncbi:MAG: ribonuclease D [Stenotrophobium sp.]